MSSVDRVCSFLSHKVVNSLPNSFASDFQDFYEWIEPVRNWYFYSLGLRTWCWCVLFLVTEKSGQKAPPGTGETVCWLKLCISLREDLCSVPSLHFGWLITACNFSFRGSHAPALGNQHSGAHTLTQTHRNAHHLYYLPRDRNSGPFRSYPTYQ